MPNDTFYCRGCQGDRDYAHVCCSGEKVGGGIYCDACCPRDHGAEHTEGLTRVIHRLMSNALQLSNYVICGHFMLALGSLGLISDSVKHLEKEIQFRLDREKKNKERAK